MNYNAPAVYVGLFTILADRARKCGYALALHGTLQKDMDLVAAPWVEWAIPPEELVKELTKAVVITEADVSGPSEKPHGRLAWILMLGMGATIDLSVMPRSHG